jgi:hypothetical protein
MAEIRLTEATGSDDSQLWWHDRHGCVQSATSLGGQDAPAPKRCPVCGEPGTWYPMYRPATLADVARVDRRTAKIEAAARKAVVDLNRALGGV